MQEAKHMSVTISSKILEIEPGFLDLGLGHCFLWVLGLGGQCRQFLPQKP